MSQQWIWKPTREAVEKTNVYRFMQRLGVASLPDFLHFSQQKLEVFWEEMLNEIGVEWFQDYQQVVDTTRGVEWARWFVNGRLNISWNCLDRHAKGPNSRRVACLWEGEDGSSRSITFSELDLQANQLANGIGKLGLEKGDRVALCMPMVPEVVAVLYACFKAGLVVVPIFSGFGPRAIATRLQDSKSRLLFTADFSQRRGKKIPLKEKVDRAVENSPTIEHVVMYRYQGGDVSWTKKRDIGWDELLAGEATEFSCLPLDSQDPALILYTSGTTGQPKGCVHTHAGCLAQMAKEIYLAFDHQPHDRFFWLSDIGWMMGPWQIIGNHHFAGTIFLYDGAPDCRGPERLWDMIERYGITTFGISPTAVRLLMGRGTEVPESHDLSSLRLLGSTGEPWDETSYMWFFGKVGKSRCPIINISGGTEIVGCFLLPLPIQPLKACSLGGPAPGMATQVFDENGHPVQGRKGYLVCTRPAPSMTRGIWGDPERYVETYWSRWKDVWYHGDWASVDDDGQWYLHGRADETLNVAGRKVGPAELEEVLIEHPLVAEASAIGVPDDMKGEAIVAFVVTPTGAEPGDQLLQELESRLVLSLGPTFRPREIHTVKELPKTQSGKVVRRLIREAYLGEALGDLTTVENPDSLAVFGSLRSGGSLN